MTTPAIDRDSIDSGSIGGIRNLCKIAIPLMVSSLSTFLMIFIDRLILARYDVSAMNAAVSAGLASFVPTLGAICIASIAEVFVGQYNGAKTFFKVGEPVWQMLWFSVFSGVIFILIALFLGPILVAQQHYDLHGLPYFQWLLFFSWASPFIAALSSFYVGLGKVRLVVLSTFLANFLNGVLDVVFVFGINGFIPEMGAKGAAIATGISQTLQALLLFSVFFNAQNREKYGTSQWMLKWHSFKECLKIGYPMAFGRMIEFSAWALLVRLMVIKGGDYLTVFTVGQSFLILFSFGTDGLQKAVMTIAANCIGAGKIEIIKTLYRSSLFVLFCILAVLAIPFLCFPAEMVSMFITQDLSHIDQTHFFSLTKMTCYGVWIFFLFDGITWVIAGILTAGGDTFFVMVMNAIAAWLFAVVPIYFLVIVGNQSPGASWLIMTLYGIVNAICFFIRYRSNKWLKLKLSP